MRHIGAKEKDNSSAAPEPSSVPRLVTPGEHEPIVSAALRQSNRPREGFTSPTNIMHYSVHLHIKWPTNWAEVNEVALAKNIGAAWQLF
jgi:hypothetical protein